MLWIIYGLYAKGGAIVVPSGPGVSDKAGEWILYKAEMFRISESPSIKGNLWGKPTGISLNGLKSDPASATLIGKSEDLKNFKSVSFFVKGSGEVRVELYYTYDGSYRAIIRKTKLSEDWRRIEFNLDEGLEYGLGMPTRPDVVMPAKLVIVSENSSVVKISGVYLK